MYVMQSTFQGGILPFFSNWQNFIEFQGRRHFKVIIALHFLLSQAWVLTYMYMQYAKLSFCMTVCKIHQFNISSVNTCRSTVFLLILNVQCTCKIRSGIQTTSTMYMIIRGHTLLDTIDLFKVKSTILKIGKTCCKIQSLYENFCKLSCFKFSVHLSAKR